MNQPACPNCGNHFVYLRVMQEIEVSFDGPGVGDFTIVEQPNGDLEWDKDTPAECADCGAKFNLGEMTKC